MNSRLFLPQYSNDLIQTARRALRLTQGEAAEKLGITRCRLADLESGRARPNDLEIQRLARELRVPARDLSRSLAGTRRLLPRGCKFPGRAPFYLAPRQRPSYYRLHAARTHYPQILPSLEAVVARRSDRPEVECFLRDAPLESRLEMAATVRLLHLESETGWASPQRWGFRTTPIIDPETQDIIGDLLFPALYLVRLKIILFPQVTLDVKGRPRLDYLMGRRIRGGIEWGDLEFDGPGHDSSQDPERQKAIGLPTLRYTEEQVLAPGFLDQFARDTHLLAAA